jgi:hypothetical protein
MTNKSRNNKKHGRLHPFVPLVWDLLNSNAYKSLKFSAAKILPYFLGKPKLNLNDPEYYKIQFSFSYPEAKNLGFSKTTFAACIEELQEKGFIKKVVNGGLKGNGQGYNRFRLSGEWRYYNQKTPAEIIQTIKGCKIET